MRRTLYLTIILFVIILGAIIACGPSKETLELQKKAESALGTLPDKMLGSENDTTNLVSLGEKLYFDNRLSVNDSQSCNSCHINKELADEETKSIVTFFGTLTDKARK